LFNPGEDVANALFLVAAEKKQVRKKVFGSGKEPLFLLLSQPR